MKVLQRGSPSKMPGTTWKLRSPPLRSFVGTGFQCHGLYSCAIRRKYSSPAARRYLQFTFGAANSSNQRSEQEQVAELAGRVSGLEREVRELRSEVTGNGNVLERLTSLEAAVSRMNMIFSGIDIPIYSTWWDTAFEPLRLRSAAQVAALILDRTDAAAGLDDVTHATDKLVQAVLHEDAGMQLFLLRLVEQFSRYYQIALDQPPAHLVDGVEHFLPVLPRIEVIKADVPYLSREDFPELTKTLNAISSNARVVLLDHDRIAKALSALLVILQRGDTFPAEAWLQDYVQVGIEYSVARRENNCALAKELLADNLVLFSLLAAFNCTAVPVSPSLSSELCMDVAERIPEPGGVLHIRLGVEVKGSLDDAREAMADYNIRLAYWELAILLRYMEWACTVVTGCPDKVKVSGLVGVPNHLMSVVVPRMDGKRFDFTEPYSVDMVQIPP